MKKKRPTYNQLKADLKCANEEAKGSLDRADCLREELAYAHKRWSAEADFGRRLQSALTAANKDAAALVADLETATKERDALQKLLAAALERIEEFRESFISLNRTCLERGDHLACLLRALGDSQAKYQEAMEDS